jgi:hypothetical protein
MVWSRMFINIAKQTTMSAIQRRRSCMKVARDDGMVDSLVNGGLQVPHPLIVTKLVSVKLTG